MKGQPKLVTEPRVMRKEGPNAEKNDVNTPQLNAVIMIQ